MGWVDFGVEYVVEFVDEVCFVVYCGDQFGYVLWYVLGVLECVVFGVVVVVVGYCWIEWFVE